jgi:hypothetical protein
MEDNQNIINSLKDIKLSALGILERLNGTNPGDVQAAMTVYSALVDRFYQVCEHLAPHQYRVAKQDFEYFMRLVDLAMAYYRDGVEGGNVSMEG